MVGRPATVLVIGVLGMALGAGATGGAQQFRAGVDVVRLPVVVTGRDGQLVRGLTAADFEVLEDRRPQTVAYFAEGAPGEALPLHLGLLLDHSGSMDNDLTDASRAAIQFVTALEEAVDVTSVEFDSSVHISRFMPPSYPTLFERIRAGTAGGGTSLYDAIGAYISLSMTVDGQHVLVLYTDGGDSTSRMNYGQLQDLLRLGNVMIYAVGYLQHQTSGERAMQQVRLTAIARETGGDALFLTSARELHEFYARILDELGSRYTLGYVPTRPQPDGKFRKVQVRLKTPSLKGAKVRTRSGYLSPRPPE